MHNNEVHYYLGSKIVAGSDTPIVFAKSPQWWDYIVVICIKNAHTGLDEQIDCPVKPIRSGPMKRCPTIGATCTKIGIMSSKFRDKMGHITLFIAQWSGVR